MLHGPVKQRGQVLGGDALAVVHDGKPGKAAVQPNGNMAARGGFSVEHGVFQQIAQHLLNQNGVHGDHQKLSGGLDVHIHRRIALAELSHGFAQPPRSLGFLSMRFVVADAGDGQQFSPHE